MLLQGDSALHQAYDEGRAVGAFVAYNLEIAQGIVAAAEATGQPVFLIAGSSAFRHAGFGPLSTLAIELARESSASVGVHLDHSRSFDEVRACLERGYTSVMFDGAHLSLEENVSETIRVVETAHQYGAWVEAELVGLAGDEDVSIAATAGAMTDPSLAARFVDETGIDALSVAVGNVHGLSSEPVTIDFERLAILHEQVRVPLVLHGASGLDDDVVQRCLSLGVAKVNVNAELRRAFLQAVAREVDQAIASGDVAMLLGAGRQGVTAAATRAIQLLARRS